VSVGAGSVFIGVVTRMIMLRKKAKYLILGAVFIVIAIQFAQPDRTNPPADSRFDAIAKSAPDAAPILKRACADCHSNETTWPWYSRIAPVSWLVADDVKEGRAHLNFSEWNFLSPEASAIKLREICREVKSGGMPMWQYRLMHPEARLTPGEIEKICSASGPVATVR
jgi:hypothetical protein